MISFITCKHNINDKYSNDNYHDDVKKISYLLLVCPKCKTVGLFHRHAVYSRYLFNNTEEYITIQRVRCESCGSTHALLPDIIIPYRYFSSPFIILVISYSPISSFTPKESSYPILPTF